MDEMSDEHQSTTGTSGGTPRWVKVFGIVFAVLVVIFVVGLLVGGGHGPSRHQPSDQPGSTQHTAPVGGHG